METIKEEKESQVDKIWRTIAIILGGIITILLLGENVPKLNLQWVGLIVVMYIMYLGYIYYINKLRVPDINQMIKTIKKEEAKRGQYIDDTPENVLVESIGTDLFAVRIINEGITYILYRNILQGRTYKEIFELQTDINKSQILQEFAKSGTSKVLKEAL